MIVVGNIGGQQELSSDPQVQTLWLVYLEVCFSRGYSYTNLIHTIYIVVQLVDILEHFLR